MQTSGLPGQGDFHRRRDRSAARAAPRAARMDVFSPPGSRLWGNSSVGVRCGAPTPWTIYVTVTVRVTGPYVASARALTAGQALTQGDLTRHARRPHPDARRRRDRHRPGGRQDARRARCAPGQPLRADLLRTPERDPSGPERQSGLRRARVSGSAPTARRSNNAAVGQVAQVRMNSGQTVSGIARPTARSK